jgi:phenylacetate-CoA ligase
MATLARELGSKPLQWFQMLSRYYARKKTTDECRHVLLLLTKMHQGQSEGLLQYRSRKLSQILKYAYQHCQYYRSLMDEFRVDPDDLRSFQRLPLLDKAIIRSHRADLVSDEIEGLEFHIANTGGSTGEPLEFPASLIAGYIDHVHQEFLYRVMGYNPGDVIVAFDGSSVPEELRRNHVYWVETGPGDIPYGRLSYSSLYMTRETMPYYIQHILHCRPSILRGYPSFIADVADYILKNNISIPFSIKGVELTAENAYDWQVEKIKKAFRARVFFQYGHSEASVFGYTFDGSYEYFCSPFYGYTEVLDSDRIHVKKGEIGEIVVTGFYNRAFPFVRYRTGDLAVFDGDEGGVVRLKKIIGRTQDYIYRRDGQRVALTALVFGQHYHAFRNMLKWQIVQGIPGLVEIRIVRGEDFSSDDEKEIRRKFKDICDVDVDFEFVDSIALTSRGKSKFLVQNIEP